MTSLLLHPPPRQSSSSSIASQKSPRAPTAGRSAPTSSLLLGTGRQSKLSAPASPSSSRASSNNLLDIQEKARRHARYKIVQEKRSISSLSTGERARKFHEELPPLVRSTAKSTGTPFPTGSARDDIKILEARVDTDSDPDDSSNDPIARKLQEYSKSRQRHYIPDALKNHSSSSLSKGNDFSRSSSATKEEDDIMMNFVPMLQEYLSCDLHIKRCSLFIDN